MRQGEKIEWDDNYSKIGMSELYEYHLSSQPLTSSPPCRLSAGDHAFCCVPGTLPSKGHAFDYLRAFVPAVPFAWTSLSLDFSINAPFSLL